MADVEMKDARTKGDVKDDAETPPLSPVAEMKSNVALIERAVSTLEPRFTIRVLRSLTALRKRLDDKALCDAVSEVYSQGALVNASHRFAVLMNSRSSGQVVSTLVPPWRARSRRIHGS